MADYNSIKDYKQLYHKLWSEMYNKVGEMQKLLADSDRICTLIQYENKEFEGIIQKSPPIKELFGKNKNKAEE